MKHHLTVQVGPRRYRIGSTWRQPIDQMRLLYRDYPKPDERVADYTVRLESQSWWRRYVRPSVAINGDYMLPDAFPLPLPQGMLAAEMAMNLQMALGERHLLLLHAACVERDGRAVIITGESGAGKSTLSALLGEKGWRFFGDEFTLVDPATGLVHPFPRPVSLKNESIAVMQAIVGETRLGPLLEGTPKGNIRHLMPPASALAAMEEPAKPVLILFPRFGHERAIRPMDGGEVFMRLTQASTNYVALAERGFDALTSLVKSSPACAVDYPDTETAISLVEELWAART